MVTGPQQFQTEILGRFRRGYGADELAFRAVNLVAHHGSLRNADLHAVHVKPLELVVEILGRTGAVEQLTCTLRKPPAVMAVLRPTTPTRRSKVVSLTTRESEIMLRWPVGCAFWTVLTDGLWQPATARASRKWRQVSFSF